MQSDRLESNQSQLAARLTWQQACDLSFRGDVREWERLLGAAPRRGYGAAGRP